MGYDFTKDCIEQLTDYLRKGLPNYPQWVSGCSEKHFYGANLGTSIDIYGEREGFSVLIQFEMHRQSGQLTNAIKARYCLEKHPSKTKYLIMQILTPFSEDTKLESNPFLENNQFPPNFINHIYKTETRKNARSDANNFRVLCKYLEDKGWLNTASIKYQVHEWNLNNYPTVRKACIVKPESKAKSPPDTNKAIRALAEELKEVIISWQANPLKS